MSSHTSGIVHWWDQVRYQIQKPLGWFHKRRSSFWAGISVLVFHADGSRDPGRLRINYLTLIFLALLLGGIPVVSLYNFLSSFWQPAQTYQLYAGRLALVYNMRESLQMKRQMLTALDDQLRQYQQASYPEAYDLMRRLRLERDPALQDKGHLSQSSFNLDLVGRLNSESTFLLGPRSYHSLHLVWHRLTIHQSMPRGRPLLGGAGNLTSGFGGRDNPTEANAGTEFHSGVDFADAPGTPLIATASGLVVRAVDDAGQGYGKHVRIHHGYGITSLYAHCKDLNVKQGQYVRRGEVVGYLGRTGRATGNHIHYEVQYGNNPAINPMQYIQLK